MEKKTIPAMAAQDHPAGQDTISLGERFKTGGMAVLKAGVGAIGSTVGGVMGVLPGVTYAIDRKLNTEK